MTTLSTEALVHTTRRLTVAIDAGDSRCGPCSYVASGRIYRRCALFSVLLERTDEGVAMRCYACCQAEIPNAKESA